MTVDRHGRTRADETLVGLCHHHRYHYDTAYPALLKSWKRMREYDEYPRVCRAP